MSVSVHSVVHVRAYVCVLVHSRVCAHVCVLSVSVSAFKFIIIDLIMIPERAANTVARVILELVYQTCCNTFHFL
jgi:hypothetical protein